MCNFARLPIAKRTNAQKCCWFNVFDTTFFGKVPKRPAPLLQTRTGKKRRPEALENPDTTTTEKIVNAAIKKGPYSFVSYKLESLLMSKMSLGNSKDFVKADDFLPTFANLAISGKKSCTIGNTEIKLWQKVLGRMRWYSIFPLVVL